MSNPNTIKDDITFMRQLAEQGRSTPILGGIFLAIAGALFGACCFLQWAMIARGATGLAPTLGLWGGAMLLFALIWLVLFFQMRDRGVCASGISNKAFHASWLGNGIGITVGCIGVGIASAVDHSPDMLASYPPMVFAFYGTAWLVSAAIARRRWMYVVSATAYAFSLILALISDQIWILPGMGVALFLTLTVPGVLLMREKAL